MPKFFNEQQIEARKIQLQNALAATLNEQDRYQREYDRILHDRDELMSELNKCNKLKVYWLKEGEPPRITGLIRDIKQHNEVLEMGLNHLNGFRQDIEEIRTELNSLVNYTTQSLSYSN